MLYWCLYGPKVALPARNIEATSRWAVQPTGISAQAGWGRHPKKLVSCLHMRMLNMMFYTVMTRVLHHCLCIQFSAKIPKKTRMFAWNMPRLIQITFCIFHQFEDKHSWVHATIAFCPIFSCARHRDSFHKEEMVAMDEKYTAEIDEA